MRKRLAGLAVCLIAWIPAAAWAQYDTPGVSSGPAPSSLYSQPGLWVAPQSMNGVVAARTAHDEIIATDGVMAANSPNLSSASAAFTSNDVGKTLIVNGAGVAGADLITTIQTVTDATHVVLAASATFAVPWWSIGRAYHASTTDVSTSYVIGDVLTLSGGTIPSGGVAGAFTIISLEASTPTVAAGGSGGANGACVVQGTTGVTRTNFAGAAGATRTAANGFFTASGTVTGGVLQAGLTIVQPGDYSTAPTSEAAEPVVPLTGCAGLVGATVAVKMAPHTLNQSTPGHYTALPANPVSVTGGNGADATLTLYGLGSTGNDPTVQGDQTGGYYAYGTDDTTAINDAIAATQAAGGGTVLLPPGRSLMLGAINIPFVGTSPPIQPSLEITGAGSPWHSTRGGHYIRSHGGPANGSMIDNRYSGGDGAGHVAKLDTRGMGKLALNKFSLMDWGTDNFLMFQTTNTQPFIDHMAFFANPTCFQQSCLQDVIRLGGILANSTQLSTTSANAGYQANAASISHNYNGFIREFVQFGDAANSANVSFNQVDSTSGSWSTAPIHLYGAGNGGSGYNMFLANEIEVWGYPYGFFSDHVSAGNNSNMFLANQIFDGSGLAAGRNGAPTLGGYFFDASSAFSIVISAPEDDFRNNFVTQLGTPTNTVIGGYQNNPAYFPQGIKVLGNTGLGGSVTPLAALDVGDGTGAKSIRVTGGNSGTGGGSSLVFIEGSTTAGGIGNKSALLGGAYDGSLAFNSNVGGLGLYAANVLHQKVTTAIDTFAFPIGYTATVKTSPTTGGTVTMAASTQVQIIDPAGTLATLTVQLPPCTLALDGLEVQFKSTKTITALTVTAASGSVAAPPTTLAIGDMQRMHCLGSNTTWY